ncbi:thioesterase II family protein [Hymenobacter elongatus]|uniref:Thioesterase n=1 Tax=Hymenobacter elongatus TaxID=877208 RepID=A0A4Z0PIQ2_9BACT|nr:alpha/beta fold hydrolase [Hymenobacter elongatus]TGE15079.1 thioesterase [Hymenobacter elongatus]
MKKPKLFLMHFAGGNCFSFQFLLPLLSDFEVFPLELPGRGRRMREPLIRDFDQAAKDMYHQVMQVLALDAFSPSKFLIYGHSMGARLAFKVAGLLEKAHKAPQHIIISGSSGPSLMQNDRKIRHLMDTPTLKQELLSLGGLPLEILENAEVFDFFEPIIRSDFEVVERNQLGPFPPIQTPIYAVMGSEEETAPAITNWQQYTTAGFTSEVLPGNHFFIHQHPRRMAEIIQSCYATTPVYKY